MLVAQGFSALWLFELVSLWVFGDVILPLWTPVFCLYGNHAETLSFRKVSLWLG